MIWMVKAEFIRPSTGARTGRAPPLAPWALERSSGRPWVQVRASKQSDEPQRDRAACGGAGAPRQTRSSVRGVDGAARVALRSRAAQGKVAARTAASRSGLFPV